MWSNGCDQVGREEERAAAAAGMGYDGVGRGSVGLVKREDGRDLGECSTGHGFDQAATENVDFPAQAAGDRVRRGWRLQVAFFEETDGLDAE